MRTTSLISLGLSIASLALPSQAIELDLDDEGVLAIHKAQSQRAKQAYTNNPS